jgi:hypothetical protein
VLNGPARAENLQVKYKIWVLKILKSKIMTYFLAKKCLKDAILSKYEEEKKLFEIWWVVELSSIMTFKRREPYDELQWKFEDIQ